MEIIGKKNRYINFSSGFNVLYLQVVKNENNTV